MKIATVLIHKEWSNRIRRRGIRRVAREAKIDYGWLSRAVNDRVIVSQRALDKLTRATNNLKPFKFVELKQVSG